MASRKKHSSPAKQKKDGIHFVNARPASETEKLKAQRLVRAHVGRWISDQTKDRSATLDSSSGLPRSLHRAAVRDGGSPLPAGIVHADPSSSYSLVSRPSPSPFPTHCGHGFHQSVSLPHDVRSEPPREWQDSPFPAPSHSSDSSDSSDDASTGTAFSTEAAPAGTSWHKVPSIEPQISAVFDPFWTYPSHFSPEDVHRAETYCLSVLWPTLAPSRPGHSLTAGQSWFPLALSDPALFTAFMFGSLCHLRVQWLNHWVPETTFGKTQERFLQLCEVESIKLISEAVRDPTRAVSDAVLLSVICMAHHRADEERIYELRKTPFNPPLQRLQWIDVYGCLPPNMVHVQGLVQLIRLRGGLKNIRLTGLATTISFSDIATCSILLCCPGFEFWPLDDSRIGVSVQELLGFGPSDIEHGFGRFQEIGFTLQMAEAFHAAHTYINIVKAHLAANSPDVSLIADQRNITQHTLLSLPPASDVHSFSQPSHAATYEACRLALLILGVGVIFPIPAQNTPLHYLARQIQSVLRQPNSSTLWSSPGTRIPLLWVLTLAGIAASGYPERAWFVSALGETARRNGLPSWPDVKRAVQTMVWYDVACDDAAEALWFEVQRTYVID